MFDLSAYIRSFTGKPLMGIVNVTPDSFSDGGTFLEAKDAIAHGMELIRQGAVLLDIGGESTRPGYIPVSAEEEKRRVLPVISGLTAAATDIPLSIDTTKSSVADAALASGAKIVNDISAMTSDNDMCDIVAKHQAGGILMHCLDLRVDDTDPVATIGDFLLSRRDDVIRKTGLPATSFAADPGIGFGKSDIQIFKVLDSLSKLRDALYPSPMLLAISRKSFLGRLATEYQLVENRLAPALEISRRCRNGYDFLRVHEIPPYLAI